MNDWAKEAAKRIARFDCPECIEGEHAENDGLILFCEHWLDNAARIISDAREEGRNEAKAAAKAGEQ